MSGSLADGTSIILDPVLTEKEETVIIPTVPTGDDDEDEPASLPYLGGGENNYIPPNTAYANLHRPVSLRPPHSKDLKSFAGGEQAKELFLEIHNASLSVNYKIQQMHPRFSASFTVIKGNQSKEEKSEKNSSNAALSFPSSLDLQLEAHGREVSYKTADVWSTLFSMRQMHALVCRALHRLFRTHAATLPKTIRDQIKNILESRYIYANWWSEALDLTISFADANFNTKSDDMVFAFNDVGQALQGAGRFLDAAPIHEDAAELQVLVAKGSTNASGRINVSRAFEICGATYNRGGDFINAERCCVRGLYAHSNVLDFDRDDYLHSLIHLLFSMYIDFPSDLNAVASFAARTEEVRMSPDFPNMAQLLPCVFGGILYLVGYRARRDRALPKAGEEDSIVMLGKNGMELLKPKLRAIKPAKQALKELAKEGNDVEAWRSKLQSFSLLDPNARHAVHSANIDTICHIGSFIDPDPPTDTTSQHKSDKELARKCITSAETCRCFNPKCAVLQEYDKFQRCPCHTVLYCGKECQVEHWKEGHGAVCPAKGQKKKTKEAACSNQGKEKK